MNDSDQLEREAIALVKQYGFFLRGPVKDFFRKLATHLNWQHLTKELK
jgi:capsule polysaccharide modification protein KpsS